MNKRQKKKILKKWREIQKGPVKVRLFVKNGISCLEMVYRHKLPRRWKLKVWDFKKIQI